MARSEVLLRELSDQRVSERRLSLPATALFRTHARTHVAARLIACFSTVSLLAPIFCIRTGPKQPKGPPHDSGRREPCGRVAREDSTTEQVVVGTRCSQRPRAGGFVGAINPQVL